MGKLIDHAYLRGLLSGLVIGILATLVLVAYGCHTAAARGTDGDVQTTASGGGDALVIEPDGGVTVKGTLSTGAATVNGTLSTGATTVNGTLSTGGQATLDSVKVTGTLSTGGQATLDSVKVTDTLSTGGQATLNSAEVTNDLNVKDLNVTGSLTAPDLITGMIYLVQDARSHCTLSCTPWGTGRCTDVTNKNCYNKSQPIPQCENKKPPKEITFAYCGVYEETGGSVPSVYANSPWGYCRLYLCTS